jgi:hypothetical protein
VNILEHSADAAAACHGVTCLLINDIVSAAQQHEGVNPPGARVLCRPLRRPEEKQMSLTLQGGEGVHHRDRLLMMIRLWIEIEIDQSFSHNCMARTQNNRGGFHQHLHI